MQAAGFTDYSAFIKAVFAAVQKHADEAGWLPVYWNIGDEPTGDDVVAQRRQRRGLPQGVPQGAALLHGAQLVPAAPTPRTRTSGWRRRCTSSPGTCTTRRA